MRSIRSLLCFIGIHRWETKETNLHMDEHIMISRYQRCTVPGCPFYQQWVKDTEVVPRPKL